MSKSGKTGQGFLSHIAALGIGSACGILIQVYKFRSGADNFWTIRLLLAMLAGISLVYAVSRAIPSRAKSTAPPREGSDPRRKGWIGGIAAFVLFLIFFTTYQFSSAFAEFYGGEAAGDAEGVYSRHLDVTRKTLTHRGEMNYSAAIPLDHTRAVVGYKIIEEPDNPRSFSVPLAFKLTVTNDDGERLTEREDTLDSANEDSREWHNFEIELPPTPAVHFSMTVRPVVSRMGLRNVLKILMSPGRSPIRAAWSEPEIFQNTPGRPNVIFISLDTLRADALGLYGAERNVSPNLDALAEESLVYRNTFSQSTWTLPSHLSMLTGKFPNELDLGFDYPVWQGSTPDNDLKRIATMTIPEVFQKNGYYCAAFTDGAFVSSYFGFYRGFHFYDEKYGRGGNSFALARKWMEQNPDKNFFLFLHTFVIHDYDFMGHGIFLNQKDNAEEEKRELFTTVRALLPEVDDPEEFLYFDFEGRRRAWYDVRIRLVDSYLGDFFSFLKERNLYDNSLIVVFSDHGESFSETHNDGKTVIDKHRQVAYDSQIRVPLIIKPPKSISGAPAEISDTMRLLDVGPTVLAALNMSSPSGFRGKPVLPGSDAAGESEYPHVFAMWDRPGGSIMKDGKKYIYQEDTGEEELYDLSDDPDEMTNLAPLQTEGLQEFRAEFSAFLSEVGNGGIDFEKSTEVAPPDVREKLKALGYIE